MKTAAPKKSQCQRLLAYLKKHRKGITTMEAFEHLRITCVHKRIAELESEIVSEKRGDYTYLVRPHRITRTREKTASGATVTRYKLAR
jgi:RNA-splicing ligase RtcB